MKKSMPIQDKKFDNVIIVLGIAITANILSTSLGIDITDTIKYMATNIAMIVK